MNDEIAPELETFHIPGINMPALTSKIEKMNRKAATIGCPSISIEIINEYQRVHPAYTQDTEITPAEWLPQITMFEIAVHGSGPKIEGWKFVGTLDLVTLPGSTIVKTVPDETVPAQYYEHNGSCDHCEKIRRRNDTFVLEGVDENTGQYQVVGRNCLRDFFGHDPSQVARFLTSLWKLMATMEDEERGFGGYGSGTESFAHLRVLQATAAVINLEGWRAKSACLDGGAIPTASTVLDIFCPPRPMGTEARQEREAWLDKLDIDGERFNTEAANAMEWLKEQTAGNDYMHNLHAIATAAAVPTKLFGFWCSLMAAYQRAQERLALQSAEKKGLLNEHVPGSSVKDRINAQVTLIGIRAFDGSYGTVYIHRMLDSDGRTLIWFANARPTMEEGKTYRIQGTVKKLDEYKGWKQTHINRVRVMQEIDSSPEVGDNASS